MQFLACLLVLTQVWFDLYFAVILVTLAFNNRNQENRLILAHSFWAGKDRSIFVITFSSTIN